MTCLPISVFFCMSPLCGFLKTTFRGLKWKIYSAGFSDFYTGHSSQNTVCLLRFFFNFPSFPSSNPLKNPWCFETTSRSNSSKSSWLNVQRCVTLEKPLWEGHRIPRHDSFACCFAPVFWKFKKGLGKLAIGLFFTSVGVWDWCLVVLIWIRLQYFSVLFLTLHMAKVSNVTKHLQMGCNHQL